MSPRGAFAWQPALAADGSRVAYVVVGRDRRSRVRAARLLGLGPRSGFGRRPPRQPRGTGQTAGRRPSLRARALSGRPAPRVRERSLHAEPAQARRDEGRVRARPRRRPTGTGQSAQRRARRSLSLLSARSRDGHCHRSAAVCLLFGAGGAHRRAPSPSRRTLRVRGDGRASFFSPTPTYPDRPASCRGGRDRRDRTPASPRRCCGENVACAHSAVATGSALLPLPVVRFHVQQGCRSPQSHARNCSFCMEGEVNRSLSRSQVPVALRDRRPPLVLPENAATVSGKTTRRSVAGLDAAPVDERRTLDQRRILLWAPLRERSSNCKVRTSPDGTITDAMPSSSSRYVRQSIQAFMLRP